MAFLLCGYLSELMLVIRLANIVSRYNVLPLKMYTQLKYI